jgi:hypothetical protein
MALSISLIVLYSQLLNLKMEGGSEKGLRFREINPNQIDSVLEVVLFSIYPLKRINNLSRLNAEWRLALSAEF